MPRRRSREADSETIADKGGTISEHSNKFPSGYEWMNGRSVYWRPESRASTVANRDIIENKDEQDALTRAYAASAFERQQLTEKDIESEIQQMREWQERQKTPQGEQAPGPDATA